LGYFILFANTRVVFQNGDEETGGKKLGALCSCGNMLPPICRKLKIG